MEGSGFEELCRDQYGRVVRAAFLIVADREEALDIAQETFARAFERWGQVSKMENPVGWLYRVATNQALSRRRQLRYRLPLTRTHTEPHEPADPALASALARLTPAQRAAIVLRFYLDLSVEATALVLKKAPGTVRALTAQGIATLRDDLGEPWMEVRDG
jgi:RNA polymerase sigma-70 factor (ECF subfamily)